MRHAPRDLQPIAPAVVVSLIDRVGPDVGDQAEAGRHQVALEPRGLEERLPRLVGGRHPGGHHVERRALQRAEVRRRDGVVEHDGRAARQPRDPAQRGGHRLRAEIRHDAEPRQECRRLSVEAGIAQTIGQRLGFEVHRREHDRRRQRDVRLPQPLALPDLRGGIVHLEHAQRRVRVAIGERVQAGAEDDILPHAAGDGVRELVLDQPAARRDERPQRAVPSSRVEDAGIGGQGGVLVGADDPERQRIGKHLRLVEQLMRRPPKRHALRRPAGRVRLHIRVTKERATVLRPSPSRILTS